MKTYRLGDLGKIVTGTTPPKAHPEWFASSGVPFVTPSDIKAKDTTLKTARFISSTGVGALRNRVLPPKAISVVCIGSTIGKMSYLRTPVCTNQQINSLIVDTSKASSRFLYYRMWEIADSLKQVAGGSASPIVNKTAFSQLKIDLPDMQIQQGIAATLGALDDKIESNILFAHKLNQIANTLVEQKLKNDSTKSCKLQDLVSFNRQQVKPNSTDGVHYVDISSVSVGRINTVQQMSWDEAPSRARRGVSDGDLIVSTVRPGRQAFALVLMPHPLTVVSTGFAVIRPIAPLGSSVLTYIASRKSFASYLQSNSYGSAYPAVSVSAIGEYEVNIPTDERALREIESMTMPMRIMSHYRILENQVLASLRDTLLPELMSGRIRVPEAREVVQEATDTELPEGEND